MLYYLSKVIIKLIFINEYRYLIYLELRLVYDYIVFFRKKKTCNLLFILNQSYISPISTTYIGLINNNQKKDLQLYVIILTKLSEITKTSDKPTSTCYQKEDHLILLENPKEKLPKYQ